MTREDQARIDKSEKRLRKWLVGLGIVVIGVMVGAGFFVLNQHYAHEDAKHQSAEAACRAIQKTKHALRNITEHSEEKSIQNVKAGVTSITTSVHEVEEFYDEAFEEIDDIKCAN